MLRRAALHMRRASVWDAVPRAGLGSNAWKQVKVSEILRRQEFAAQPSLSVDCTLRDAISHMTRRRLGAVLVVHSRGDGAEDVVGLLVRVAWPWRVFAVVGGRNGVEWGVW
jgi:hypothetical protein